MKEEGTIPAAIYTRKSTNHNLELETNSIEAQRQFGEAFVAAHGGEGWEVVPERYDDAAVSGATADRTALKRLLADAKAGKFKVVVFYKIDRISRNLRDFLDITDTLQKSGVRLACVAHPIDTGTAAGRAFVNLMAVFGQLEREQGAERVRDRVHAVRSKGGYIGGSTPFGYLAVDKRLVPDSARRDAVRLVFETYLRTGSLKSVAACIEANGICRPDGKAWKLTHFSYMLRNHTYVGEIEFRGKIAKAAHEPIVSRGLWDRVQNLIRERRECTVKKTPITEPHPLAGLVRCGSCGSAMSATMCRGRHRNNKIYWYFSCREDAKRPVRTCKAGRVPGGVLERLVLDRMGDFLRSADFTGLVAEALSMAPAEIRHRLENVTEFWTGLFPAEKFRLLKQLLDSVTVFPDEVAIKLKTSGIMEEIRNAN